jgi:hypothetical protein
VIGIKFRAGLLGVCALLLLGAYSAAPAFAVGGPFCHERKAGETENEEGKLIPASAPEQVAGEGGEQKLAGKIGGAEVVLTSPSTQVKGIIYNNADQCQVKILIDYGTVSVVGAPNCNVTVNSNNSIKIYGHQVWKWNGTKEQLEEKSPLAQVRDWLFLPFELPEGATELPKSTIPYATITLTSNKNGTCLLASKQLPVEGSTTVLAAPYTLGKWAATEEQIATGGEGKQQFWNGKALIGFETGLKFNSAASKYEGITKVKTTGRQQEAPQEIAYFEK